MTPRVAAPDVAPPSANVAKLKMYVYLYIVYQFFCLVDPCNLVITICHAYMYIFCLHHPKNIFTTLKMGFIGEVFRPLAFFV